MHRGRAAVAVVVLWAAAAPTGLAQSPVKAAQPDRPAATGEARTKELAVARSHFETGAKAFARGELGDALKHFEAAQAIAPSAELCFDIARTLERMGEPQRAIAMYRRYLAEAAASDAQRNDIAARIATLEAQSERLSLQSIKLTPSGEALKAEASAFFSRGVKLFRRGQYAAARSAFDAALQFAEVPELHFNLALVAERLAHPDDALAHYRAYLKAAGEPADRAQVERRIDELRAKP